MEALPVDYTTIIGSIGGFFGFLMTMIIVVVNMQKNSKHQNKNMDKLTLYVEKHDVAHDKIKHDVGSIEVSVEKLTRLTEDADRRLWKLENTPQKSK